jgi:type II secretory pathway component PulF
MPTYRYRARTMDSELLSGIVEAPGESEAAELLSERGLIVLSLVVSNKKVFKGFNINIGGVNQKDLVIFSRQLAVMISATIPIVQALRILTQQTSNPIFAEKVVEIANDVDGGMKLSDAMGKHNKIFNNFFVAMIKSGETSGRLEEVLEYLADQMEKDYDLMSRIKGAMIYPALILVALVGVSILMMVYILPKMAPMLQETGAKLPLVTIWLIAVSDFLVKYWIFLVFGLLVLIGVFIFWTKSKSGKTMWDSVKIKIPIFGNLFRKIYLVRFTRSLHTLIKGGVPIAMALRITAEVVDNKAYSDLIMQTVAEVEAGNSISTLFAKSPLMPKMLSQMMIVGEKTGRIDNILEKLSDFYSREIDNLVSNLTVLIEPLILIIMGVGVAGIVAAIMLPMYKVAQTID